MRFANLNKLIYMLEENKVLIAEITRVGVTLSILWPLNKHLFMEVLLLCHEACSSSCIEKRSCL